MLSLEAGAGLVAHRVTRRYGGVVAVDDVSLVLDPRRAVGLIGPNGSGKSTLLSVLSGQLRASSGTVGWDGQDVSDMWLPRRVGLGLVRTFQNNLLYESLTALQNIALALSVSPRSSGFTSAEELAEYVGLGHVLDSRAADLSWGEGRLLGLAMGLALAPQYLLIDEPFAGLSPSASEHVADLVRRIAASGVGICVVDHEMDYLQLVVDRMVALVNGSVVADGATADVLADPIVRESYLGRPA